MYVCICVSERRFHASSNLCCLTEYSSLAEIPKKPVTGVFGDQNGRIKVELSFNAEVSSVLIVNARALGDKELDCTVKFDMGGVSTFGQFYS